ncbi:putative transcriptional regulator [Streptomyces viridochromogenes Tue57]|uniref:Putative transcriptional regulator n=1 Tax=Streptomyces viridochromogenes Tue57 TaxID=1160705 RepID=L8PP22_STRVR|nr:putative transcriptional regulator [Streptomyces viridochromogenes Tue57]
MLADEVYEALKAMLMNNAVDPGQRLTTDSLAQEMGVSRTPVREGLARLESEGLVVKRPLAGYLVTPPLDRKALEELYTVRLLLEPAAARLAALHATEEQIEQLTADNPALLHAPASGARYEDYQAFAAEDGRFHDLLAAASGVSLLHECIRRLHAHVHTYRLWPRAGTPIEALREHAAILDALRRRDAAGAEEAMRAHLEGAHARLTNAL